MEENNIYRQPLAEKYWESELRVDERYRKAEVDLSKAMTWLEVSTNIKTELQTQRVKLHFDEDKKAFFAMIPHVRGTSADCHYRLRELFDAEDFESETWMNGENLIKLKTSFVRKPSGQVADLILKKDECTGSGLRKAFRRKGLVMKISQQYEIAMYEDILYSLISHASDTHLIFPHLGWNNLNGEWRFSSETQEEIRMEESNPDLLQIGSLGMPKAFRGNIKQIFFEALLGYILNQEILKEEMGLRLQTPLAIIVDTERTAEEIKRFLSTFIPVKEADSYLTPKRLNKLIEKAHSEPLFYKSGPGRYNEENLNLLISWARSGQLYGKIADSFPILFFSEWIPDLWRDKVLAVSICKEDMYFSAFGYTEKAWIKALSNFPSQFIKRSCGNARAICKEIGGDLKVLISAYYITTSFFRESTEAELCDAKDAICKILKDAEDGSVSDIRDIFINSIFEWIVSLQFSDCFQRCEDLSGKNLNQSILCDENYLYFPEYIFRQIIQPIKAQVSSLEIKRLLTEEGVLIKQNGEFYTVNLLLKLSKEAVKHRFYRISRQAIKKPGELDVVDLCNNYKNTFGG